MGREHAADGEPNAELARERERTTSLRRAFMAVLVAVIVLYVGWIVIPLARTRHLADDYRQNFIWLVQRHYGLGFENDPLTRYSYDFQPTALATVYGQLARAVHPYLFTKAISVALVAVFAVLCFLIGERLYPRSAAAPILCILGLVDVAWTREMMGGFARCYGLPLQAGLVWAVMARKRVVAVVLLVLAGLVHPQSLILGVSLVAGDFAWRCWKQRSVRVTRAGVVIAGVGAAAIAALLAANVLHMRKVQATFGRPLTGAEILSIAEFKQGGRWEDERPNILPIDAAIILNRHFTVFRGVRPYMSAPDQRVPQRHSIGSRLWGRLEQGRPVARLLRKSLAGIVVLLLGLEIFRRLSRTRLRDVPRIIPLLALVGCGWHIVAYAMLARLYFPNRFITAYLPLAYEMALALIFARWVQRAMSRKARWRVAVPVLVFALVLAHVVKLPVKFLPGYWVQTEQYRAVAGFLRAQPEGIVYAANPKEDADTLVAIVPRQTYIAREISHPLFRKYLYDVLRPRTRTALRALFPGDAVADVGALRAQGVDLMVMRKNDLALKRLPDEFADEPYLSELRCYWSAAKRRQRQKFWRAHERAKVYDGEHFVIYDLRKIDFSRS